MKNDECWLANQHSLVNQLKRVWVSEAFQERHRKENMAATNWKEPKLLAYCLLNYCKYVKTFISYSLCTIVFKVLKNTVEVYRHTRKGLQVLKRKFNVFHSIAIALKPCLWYCLRLALCSFKTKISFFTKSSA